MEKPNIVVLDGYALNPNDLSWENIQRLGATTIYDWSSKEQIVERASEARVIIANKTPLTADILEKLPHLRYIGLTSTGYDIVDTEFAKRKGITVTNVPHYASESVAQHTFALALNLANAISLHDQSVKNDEWTAEKGWCYWKQPLMELHGKTMGIVGFGKIGLRVAELAKAFGMKVMVHTRRSILNDQSDVEFANLRRLFVHSDIISLHCPLSPETEGIVNLDLLSKMKKTAYLINTARGKLINEPDLYKALQEGYLAGVGLDVLTVEPPAATNPLVKLPNCILTPHLAWATLEARSRLMMEVTENLMSFLLGIQRNSIV